MNKDIFFISEDANFTEQLLIAVRNQNLEQRLALLRDEFELQHFLSRSGQMPCGARMNMPRVILWNISRWTQEKVKLVDLITKACANDTVLCAIAFMSLSDCLCFEKCMGKKIMLVAKPIDTIHLDKIIDTVATWLDGPQKPRSYN